MSPSALPDPLSWTELLRVFGGLVVVIVVLVAALWLLKRFQTGLRTPGGPMRVLATLSLAPRERLLLVQVGEQQLLLGSSAQGLNCLHVLSTPVELQPPSAGQGLVAALPPSFPDWLRRAVEQRGKARP
ncbi:MAG: flagellar biosynthetic protein FliO [Thiomonas sp.]|uniref:flagellar biosynthetic protein FliO n=1 Tax=Thiomonas sp. TaxID=2047785 RepID=UPI002A36BC4F|nr:flagellar biosynthetic protein FliO [Thiomonas sp.]MDY0331480.1 flagellar biosynthetic protein FliO [Thiomonas sp.]